MTEYDYSPEAHERYITKQYAIARWVDSTNRYEPANPFLPSEPSRSPFQDAANRALERDTQDSGYDDGHHRSSSRHYHHRDEKDRQRRPTYDRYDSHHSRSSSRKDSRSSSTYPTRPHTSHSHYPQEFSPVNAQTPQYPNGQQQYPYYNHATHGPYGSSSNSPLAMPQPRAPNEQTSNMPTLVPINGGAGGYVLVPPKGATYQVVQPRSPPPTNQPWYKRVLSPTSSEAGSRKLAKSSSNGSRSRGRSSKWSLDIY
ncbi:hypothetical protein D9756_002015 [Leucocoprinus leucothites]|uniref:Uncharacterized protein n=1 Tax=Leucocoprinus leucothites TaxID=201217 RepID=A0A8H5LLH4_9AGAR|nr:hypothetical protein D9756_002015 [Leucoagaricus leucothites]